MQTTPMILDGGSGACLIKAGMPAGVCPEKWATENPQALIDLQREYITAGSDAVCTFTFGGNRVKLARHGLADECAAINTRLAKITRKAVGDEVLVAGDIGPTGLLPQPFGDTDFDTYYTVFAEQAKALEEGGVDYIAVETMMNLTEAKAALLAAKAVTELPVYVSMTCGENGRTLSGCKPEAALVVLQSAGADAVGLNCSVPPAKMRPLFEEMLKVTRVNLTAKPNGEYPDANGERHEVSPKEFAAEMKKIAEMGVAGIGGCCGSTPEHIAALSEELYGVGITVPHSNKEYVASEREVFELPDKETLLSCKIYDASGIMDAVDADEKVIRVRIGSAEDAQMLSDMLMYTRVPVSVVAGEMEPALRAAGICPARFILDPESGLNGNETAMLTNMLFAAV